LEARWKTDVQNFQLPIENQIGPKNNRTLVTNEWTRIPGAKTKDDLVLSTYKMLIELTD
jgi:hypothetical protein